MKTMIILKELGAKGFSKCDINTAGFHRTEKQHYMGYMKFPGTVHVKA
jgi:hypothetical protein